ncbi:MAG: hypothetical protein RSF34_12560 [Flavobacterium sp.]|uniref:hypothetical protein n=1 Tax=Flavobacterium sp. TaxID=239 RepID=UPI002FC97870
MKLLKYIFTLYIIASSSLIAQEQAVYLLDPKLNQFLNIRDFCMSENGQEAFFSIQSPDGKISQIVSMIRENDEWSAPELMFFCDEYSYLEPFLTYDGKRLFFVSDMPNSSSKEGKRNFDIWLIKRNAPGTPWSQPINVGSPVNSDLDEFYPTLSDNGNLYFTLDSPNGMGKDDIYVSVWNGKNYAVPTVLSEKINSEGFEFNAFVSKDERFLLYTKYNVEGDFGSGDLYISRKDVHGKWQKAVNLGNLINTPSMEYCPFYHETTQTLYFTSRRNLLMPKKFSNIQEFQEFINSENGLSKIYKTHIKF